MVGKGLCKKEEKNQFFRANVQTLGISPSFGGSLRDPPKVDIIKLGFPLLYLFDLKIVNLDFGGSGVEIAS
jgi:hypothetical protein